MPQLTVPQIANAWVTAGGAPAALEVACAVALAESGGRTGAESSTGDYGLWQINAAYWVKALNMTKAELLTASGSATAAVIISNNGTNFGDWCTMWAHPARDCASHPLAYPQAGSAAAARIPAVLPYITASTGVIDGTSTTGGKTATRNAVSRLRHLYGTKWPARWSVMRTLGDTMKGHRR